MSAETRCDCFCFQSARKHRCDCGFCFQPHLPQGSVNEYSFDAVFSPEAGQSEVYEGTAKPHISELLEGINVTVFAYGATGELFRGRPSDAELMFYDNCIVAGFGWLGFSRVHTPWFLLSILVGAIDIIFPGCVPPAS